MTDNVTYIPASNPSAGAIPSDTVAEAEDISGKMRQVVSVHNPQAGTPLDVALKIGGAAVSATNPIAVMPPQSGFLPTHAQIVDTTGAAMIYTGSNTNQKGLRVFIGPTDPISDMPVFIMAEHHHLHEGEMHQATYYPAALDKGASIDFRLVVGNLIPTSRTPHITIELDTTGESWLYLYETPTTTANGTQLTTRNKNRNQAAIAPNTTVWQAPTVTAVGTPLSAWISGAGEKSGGQARESIEWDLAANTVYLARVTAKNSNNICVRFIYYEDLGV